MLNKKGISLIEIIISIALLGIISIGFLTLFSSSIKMMNDTKKATINLFNGQEEIEKNVLEIRREIVHNLRASDPTPIEFFGKNVEGNLLEIPFPDNPSLEVFVFLSEVYSKKAAANPPVAENVKITVSNDPNDLNADQSSILTGSYDTVEGSSAVYTHLYRWYVTKPEAGGNDFPRDYQLITGEASFSLSNLSAFPNRYIVFTVTPVDVHGLRGAEVASQAVFVSGPDWKMGNFPWVDLNDNGIYEEGVDYKFDKEVLFTAFDTETPFYDEDLNEVSLLGGSLYVPTNIGDIVIDNTKQLDWIVCNNIHLATIIEVQNKTDVHLKTRNGNITLYQYQNPSGHTTGPKISTEGNINLITEGRGNINLQNKALIESMRDVQLSANGLMNLLGSTILTGGNVIIDTSGAPNIHNSRDIVIDHSIIQPEASSSIGVIEIKSRHNIEILSSEIISIGDKNIYIMAEDDIHMTNSNIGEFDADNFLFTGDVEILSNGNIAGEGLHIRNSSDSRILINASKEAAIDNSTLISHDGEILIYFNRRLSALASELRMREDAYINVYTSSNRVNGIYSAGAIFESKDHILKVSGTYLMMDAGPIQGEIQ
ncbi:hypothetical protein [Alkaliphilus serpentinus]|uniref:Prepilin-type N-terminal cleavage/methylation domain-containing protein n=1 Tax=Alkaliphilus serpentinus TaxID=1482731 RepID=A0A833HMI0_9FIRM|nr:hypothetical protein [Alkaliphilus serpentinus]KAB3527588.1 hypothetical protein F8153_11420 [Alkaliphilus serpentinus]